MSATSPAQASLAIAVAPPSVRPGTHGASDVSNLTNVNGTLYFSVDDDVSGTELWKSNGTAAGTVSVKDIAAGSDSSSPSSLVSFKGQLFFTAYDGDGGRELWKSDGTSAGTLRVKDIATSSSSADPIKLTVVGNTLCFAAYGESRRELSC